MIKKPTERDPFAADDLLSFSADALRRKILARELARTIWTNRADTIPPTIDERTALIDRGLVLRGLLTQAQLEELHTIGDRWNAYYASFYLAQQAAHAAALRAAHASKAERQQRREERRAAAAQKRQERRESIAQRRNTDILYLGPGVSPKLRHRRSNVEALTQRGLPVLSTPQEVAQAIGISVPVLRWLSYHAEVAQKTHYVHFEIPKRTGGKRQLSAPMPSLSRAQAWILQNILEKLPTEHCAHGFIKGRSTLTNAKQHCNQALVLNLDLKDFFPTITYRRVRGLFERLGYSPAAATILALLCTEAPRRVVEYDGVKYYVAAGERALPQGACTSPALSNQIAKTLDVRLMRFCERLGWAYTRYADDLTFSATAESQQSLPIVLAKVRNVVKEEGFALNPKKKHIQRRSTQQTVTGVVVNEKPGLPREEVRRLRAILHQAKTTGLEAQNKGGVPHFESHLRGKLAYLSMIDPGKGRQLLLQLEQLLSTPKTP